MLFIYNIYICEKKERVTRVPANKRVMKQYAYSYASAPEYNFVILDLYTVF